LKTLTEKEVMKTGMARLLLPVFVRFPVLFHLNAPENFGKKPVQREI
jgi:hypothetical protein